jgi:hypothetical protein
MECLVYFTYFSSNIAANEFHEKETRTRDKPESGYLVFCVCLFGLRPVSCVPNVASVSGLSILNYHFGFIEL